MIRAPILWIAVLLLAATWPADAAQTGATEAEHAPQCCRRPSPHPKPQP